MFGCNSNHGEAHRHHQSIMKVLQYLIFPRAKHNRTSWEDAVHAWPTLPAAPVRQISGSRIDAVKVRHHGTQSGSPSCFTAQKITKFIKINAPKHEDIQSEAGGKTNTEHTDSQGTGCKTKACYMQKNRGNEKP